jgi:hypothetical protein
MPAVLTLLVLPLVFSIGAGYPAPTDQDHDYIGVDGCKMCHRNPAKGNQFGQWEGTKHKTAFQTLGTDAAREIAAAQGIDDPQTAAACLECHVTGYGQDTGPTWKAEDGVSCEACHGPGSTYKAIPIMRDRDQALASGLIVPDEANCTSCHNERSPTFPGFNFEEMWELVQHPDPTKG